MVFQSHALWTHMNVFKNLAFGLKLRRLPPDEIKRKVEAVLELVGLGGYGTRLTHQLSGGQQQRVALARSLVLEPKILLLDEPFASLDQHLRERLREEVRDIQQRLKITTLFVTHGQDEALALADRIVVMRDGGTEQIDRPDVVYREPATPFVAGFIGTMNLVEGASPTAPSPIPASPCRCRSPTDPRPWPCARRRSDRPGRRAGHGEDPPRHRLRHACHGRYRTARRHPAQVDGDGGPRLVGGRPVDLKPRAFAAYRDNAAIYRGGQNG
jgi:putative spermidine/putrescine transport system ATP-binding protein